MMTSKEASGSSSLISRHASRSTPSTTDDLSLASYHGNTLDVFMDLGELQR